MGSAIREAQAFVVSQRLRFSRHAAPFQVLMARHDKTLVVGQLPDDQAFIACGQADSNRDIDSLCGQVQVVIGDHHVEDHTGILAQEGGKVRRKAQPAICRRHGNTQRANGRRTAVEDAVVSFSKVVEHLADLLDIRGAGVGQADAPRGARE